jgi:isoprenylcysteine carboxyl methyltransferase (ICMT) family protein YpbQ
VSLRPSSATTQLTGIAGVIAVGIAVTILREPALPVYLKALFIAAAAAAAMIVIETALFRTHHNPSTGLTSTPSHPFSLERTVRKVTALYVTFSVIAAGYWFFPIYRRPLFDNFWPAIELVMPCVILAAPIYIALIDRRQREPEDAYAAIGSFILHGKVPSDMGQIVQYALGWTVKAFFLPLMFAYMCGSLNSFLTILQQDELGRLDVHRLIVTFFFLLDVSFAVAGYSLTLRILDTHIRSAEPTAFGWLVCLICYDPFVVVMNAYFSRDVLDNNWFALLAAWPVLQIFWSAAILICIFIYVWSTVSFGLRFSNLTHRGIITSGPYRFVKHPAYIAKNLAWWLVSLPFFNEAGLAEGLRHSLMLLCINGIYLLRAWTEERHLARDPAYRAYQDYIRAHGLWARMIRSTAPLSAALTSPLRATGMRSDDRPDR